MLISPEYQSLNEQMHSQGWFKGAGTLEHLERVREYAETLGAASVLDYGCGKAKLSESLPNVTNYDPGVPEYSADPPACDLVVCLDVMEHIESQCLDDVLAHIRGKAKLGAYFCIATRWDKEKRMPDGSNPHKIVRRSFWWRSEIARLFAIDREEQRGERDVIFWCR